MRKKRQNKEKIKLPKKWLTKKTNISNKKKLTYKNKKTGSKKQIKNGSQNKLKK
jgi:hypothetical protein